MNVYDCANELAKAMRASQEYKTLKEAKAALEQDPKGKEMAEEFLKLGIKENEFVVEILLDIRPIGEIDGIEEFDDTMIFGEESEAVNYIVNNRESWEEVSGSLAWLWKEYEKNGGKERFLIFES